MLPAPQMRTLRYIIDKVKLRYGQSDPRLENQIVPELTDRMREICSKYPFWFLDVEPGTDVFASLPLPQDQSWVLPTTTQPNGWVDRGWLVISAGVPTYGLQLPPSYLDHSPSQQQDPALLAGF